MAASNRICRLVRRSRACLPVAAGGGHFLDGMDRCRCRHRFFDCHTVALRRSAGSHWRQCHARSGDPGIWLERPSRTRCWGHGHNCCGRLACINQAPITAEFLGLLGLGLCGHQLHQLCCRVPRTGCHVALGTAEQLSRSPYFLIRVLVQDLETFGKAFRILLGVAVVESTYGLLCSVSNHIFGTTTGMAVGEYLVDVAAPYGSMYEPNLFGAYAAACAVMFLSLYLAAEHHRLGHLIGFLVASIASVLSFSRAALFALVVVICFILWKARSAKNGHRTKVVILGLAGGLASLVAVTAVGGVLQERIANLLTQGLSEETTISRVIVIQQALQEVPAHPWLGSGTASFNLSFDWTPYVPEWASDKTWIANAPLRIIHDTGVLGLTAFLGFLVSLWLKIRRTPDKPNSQFPELFALSAGTLLYGISFQFTDGTILAFVWVQLGFLATAAILMNDCESDGRATRSAS